MFPVCESPIAVEEIIIDHAGCISNRIGQQDRHANNDVQQGIQANIEDCAHQADRYIFSCTQDLLVWLERRPAVIKYFRILS